MKVDTATLVVMSTAFEYPAEDQVRIAARLDKPNYVRVNRVLEALGGKWSRKLQVHVFDEGRDPVADIERVINTGEVETSADVGHFPTPPALARRLVEMAGVEKGMRVLEPSAGDGALVRALLDVLGVDVVAIERDPKRRIDLEELAITVAQSPRTSSKLTVMTIDDCMLSKTLKANKNGFDRVVMNPPFCKVGLGDHLDHVQHMFEQLKNGGRLVSVLPSSITFRKDRRHTEFRAFVDRNRDRNASDPITLLPDGSFKESGTGVSTVTINICRR